ncbi:HAD family hydrolase [Allostreptomyces psammosilenae]|uniref:Hydrolase n=1 Tax=Allostreptomyces psammosilenae TaxID=1892865 RepID=A0A852ZSI2_9ACTN|nr:HAD family hydrolase [Allostreptomyces psammosilenae]NYI04220.1 hypothetical protein [Allostreptomyces psammosilenae]
MAADSHPPASLPTTAPVLTPPLPPATADGRPRPHGSQPARPHPGGRFRAVATDLDGTLLRGDLTVSERSRRALGLAVRAGARHIVVTGRPVPGCRPILDALGYRGLAVCGQGTQLYDAGTHRLLAAYTLDREVARAVVARTAAELGPLQLAVVTAGLDGRFVVGPGFDRRPRRGWGVVEDPEELWSGPIEKVLLRHPTLPDAAIAAAAERAAGGEATVTHAGERLVEILPAGVTKASGLRLAAERLGFRPEETIAFGDMPNDLPMFEWAGYGVAMANAHPSLLAVADEIAPGNEEDGVAAVLERVFGGAPGGAAPVAGPATADPAADSPLLSPASGGHP